MFFAISKEKGRVSADKVASHRVKFNRPLHGKGRVELLCPFCNSPVHLVEKKGFKPFFRHCSLIDCEYSEADRAMTKWHSAWQGIFPENLREGVMETMLGTHLLKRHSNVWGFPDKTNGSKKPMKLKHRADIRCGNVVIEFQHSKMTPEEFAERTWFYNVCGCYVIWVFDVSDEDMNVVDASNTVVATVDKIKDSHFLIWSWDKPYPTFELVSPAIKRLQTNFELIFCRRTEYKGDKLKNALLYRVVGCEFDRSNNGSRGFRIPSTEKAVEIFSRMSTFFTTPAFDLQEFVNRVKIQCVATQSEAYYKTLNFID